MNRQRSPTLGGAGSPSRDQQPSPDAVHHAPHLLPLRPRDKPTPTHQGANRPNSPHHGRSMSGAGTPSQSYSPYITHQQAHIRKENRHSRPRPARPGGTGPCHHHHHPGHLSHRQPPHPRNTNHYKRSREGTPGHNTHQQHSDSSRWHAAQAPSRSAPHGDTSRYSFPTP